MIDEAIKQKILDLLLDDPSMILLLKSKYISEDIWKFCIEREPSLFKEMRDPSEDMCYFALEEDGHNLKYIKKRFKNITITRRMAYIAISNCPKAIFYVPQNILDDGLKELAFDGDPSLMKSFTNVRREYVIRKVRENPAFIKYVNNPDEDMICDAIRKEPNVYVYLNKFTPRITELIKELYPQLIPLIPGLNS